MNDDNYKYDPEIDLWKGLNGEIYVKNEFNPNLPIFINVGTDIWSFKSDTNFQINWSQITLPTPIKNGAKEVLKTKLKKSSNSYVGKFRNMLLNLSRNIDSSTKDFSSLNSSSLLLLMNSLDNTYNKNFFREMYKVMADLKLSGAKPARYLKLKELVLRKNIQSLKDVLKWHQTKGAMTQAEELLLKNAIQSSRKESNINKTTRLFCWLLMDTIKRSKQIRDLSKDCLKIIQNNGVTEYFIEITLVKYQTGRKNKLWPISSELYVEMSLYSNRPSIKKLQNKYNRFLVYNCKSLHRDGVLCGGVMNANLKSYIAKKLKIISCRTTKPLHVTSTRIRHTGATRLAFWGVSRDIISEILEHDDPKSCQSYIDAVGSELCPKMELVDRNMGSLFKSLNKAYFNGQIADDLKKQKIVTPYFPTPASTLLYVGSCNKNTLEEGQCKKHPFVECYNGCPHFLAWRHADHKKALQYTEREIIRWKTASNNKRQQSTIFEFEQLKENILIVIANINKLNNKKGNT